MNYSVKFFIGTIIGVIVLWCLLFLGFAFVQAEINPFKWSKEVRGGYVFGVISITFLAVPFTALIKNSL